MAMSPSQQATDDEQIRILSIVYYVFAGLSAVGGCLPFIHVFVGILFLVNPPQVEGPNPFPAEFFGMMFVVFGLFVILCCWAIAILQFLTARSLANRTRHSLCVIASAISCLFVPLGTILGVFSLIVLMRPSVKEQFEAALTAFEESTPGESD